MYITVYTYLLHLWRNSFSVVFFQLGSCFALIAVPFKWGTHNSWSSHLSGNEFTLWYGYVCKSTDLATPTHCHFSCIPTYNRQESLPGCTSMWQILNRHAINVFCHCSNMRIDWCSKGSASLLPQAEYYPLSLITIFICFYNYAFLCA